MIKNLYENMRTDTALICDDLIKCYESGTPPSDELLKEAIARLTYLQSRVTSFVVQRLHNKKG